MTEREFWTMIHKGLRQVARGVEIVRAIEMRYDVGGVDRASAPTRQR